MVNHDVQKCTQPHQSDYPKAQSSKMFQVSNCFRSSSAARRSFISFLQPAGDLASVGDWELEHNTSNRLIDAARHISTCKQSGLPDFHSKPERKCRATSSETARESTPRWSLLFIFGLLGARWMEASQLREAPESWLLTFYSSNLIKTIWISSRFFSKRIPHIQTVFTTLPRTKAWILWWMTSMQCTCVSLAALSRNSLADSRSFKFFNSISNAWFNHFPDGLVHRGFEMISVQANVQANGCRYCRSES